MFYFTDNTNTYHHFLLCGDAAEELGTARMAGREVGNAVNATDRFQVVVGTRAPMLQVEVRFASILNSSNSELKSYSECHIHYKHVASTMDMSLKYGIFFMNR